METQNGMRYRLKILVLILLTSCLNTSKNKLVKEKSEEPKTTVSNTVIADTTNTSFPIQIGNDKGLLKITAYRSYKDQKLTNSNFIITLADIPQYSMSKKLSKRDVIDANETVILKDTIHADYLNGAILKKIEFDFVRSNTLYFNAVLENSVAEKEILGRFSILYTTKQKGMIYGWITDEVKETTQAH